MLTSKRCYTMETEFKYKDLTGRIIGAAMLVHKVLGNGIIAQALEDVSEVYEAEISTVV